MVRSMRGALASVFLFACVLSMPGCGGGGDNSTPAEPTGSMDTPVVPSAPNVTGRALNAATGLGVSGVTVRIGAQQTTTDATGNFALTNIPAADRVAVTFSSPDFAETTRIASVSAAANATTDVQVRLLPVAQVGTVAVTTGGTVTVAGSPAQVSVPANGVQRADGSLPTGQITVSLTPIDPGLDSSIMPGDFSTVTGGGTVALIESFGALSVRLTDESGASLNLRAGQTAIVRIPLGSRNEAPPATIPLFYFDPAEGRWVQEGTAALAGAGDDRYYEGTVARIRTWNADQVYETVQVRGCVADADGHRVAHAQVFGDGIDYSGTSTVWTDDAGNFSLPVRRNSVSTLTGVASGLLTNTLRQATTAVDVSLLPSCLTLGHTGAGVTMKLTWGKNPSDLDSHLFAPNGEHVYYSSKGHLLEDPFANLDVDDVSSYGPEVVTLTKLMVGTYKYAVKNFSGYASGSMTASGARVELNIPGRAVTLFVPPTSGEQADTEWWNLFEFDVDASCNITVRRVGTYSSADPTPGTGPTTYCTPH